MNISSLGDLAQSYAMKSRNTALKSDLQRLVQEVTTGQVADKRDVVTSNAAYVSDLERSLTKLEGYELATFESGQHAAAAQSALDRVSTLNAEFRDTILVAGNMGFGETAGRILLQAKGTLDDMIGTLNTSVAGRSIFSGTATDRSPLASTEDLLAGLGAAVAGAGSVDDILATAEAWFDDPAGFGTTGYLGSDRSLAAVSLSDQNSVQWGLRADDPILRDTLRNLAVASLAGDPALGLTDAQQSELIQKSVASVMNADVGLINLRTQIGFNESRIEAISVRNGAERAALSMARSDLLSVDPFEAATELEQVQFQLQSLYAITARMSQTSLVNYL